MVDDSLAENISAVSAVFHQDDRYQIFYDMYASTLSGFPGIWTFCAWAGIAFRNVEVRMDIQYDDGRIAAIDGYVERIFRCSLDGVDPVPPGDPQNMEWLETLAAAAINEHVAAHQPDVHPDELPALRKKARFAAALLGTGPDAATEYKTSDQLAEIIQSAQQSSKNKGDRYGRKKGPKTVAKTEQRS